MEDPNELLGNVLSGCAYFTNLLYVIAAIVAFVRLKVSAAGLLTGGGLLVMSFCGLGMKLFRTFVLNPQLRDYDAVANMDDVMVQMQAASFTSTCTSALCWMAVAIGILMIPKAFPKPAEAT